MKQTKKLKTRISSGLLAAALLFGQIPLISAPVKANQSQNQAYFQVLDDIVKEYGMYTQGHTGSQNSVYASGLTSAFMVDFDQDGSDELVVAYIGTVDNGEVPLYEHCVEIWGFRGNSSTLLDKMSYYYEPKGFTLDFVLYKKTNGEYFIQSESTGLSGGGVWFSSLSNGIFSQVRASWESVPNPDGGLVDKTALYFTGSEVYDELLIDETESVTPFIQKAFPEYVNATTVAGLAGETGAWDNNWVVDTALYYDLQNQGTTQVLADQSQELEEILAKLPYTGDISKMFLTAEQALAMAEEIENLQSDRSFVALFDSGTYVPAMVAVESIYDEHTLGSRFNQESQEIEFYISGEYSPTVESHLYIWNKEDKKINLLDDSEFISGQRTEIEVNDGETKIYRGGFSTGGEDSTNTIIISDFNGGNSEIIYTKLAVSCPNMMFDLEWWASLYGIEVYNVDEHHLLNYDPNTPDTWASGLLVNGYTQPVGDDFEELPFPENPDICFQFPFYSEETCKEKSRLFLKKF